VTPRLDAWLRVLASIAGTLPVALLASLCLARFLPLSEDARFALGYTAAIPLWIAAMCVAFLARSGARAWAACLAASALLAAVVYGVPR
jgi:hypothetical protein